MTETYFFDSYALIEILKGSPSYDKYIGADFLLTKLNLFEVYESILKDFGEKEAILFLEDYYGFAIDYEKETIIASAKLHLSMRKRHVSMTDCIGYTIAQQYNIPFLTGDKEFRDLDGVEFVQ